MHNYMELVEDKELFIILMFVLKEIVNNIHVYFGFVTFTISGGERRVMGHFILPSILVKQLERIKKKKSFFIVKTN